ncbi:hypothetical protein [Actinophytocola glycyrrhizae]|uniref:PPE family protein n=1 Tax=Actinophytocola glycyrrhizae TaxID=2044873 RepID=A0ABV9RWS0_9PSEU
MSDAWERYFTEPPAEGGVNWEAYSHDELYQMLWQDADVADVSTVATEWARHRAALATHAEVLREQSVALLDSWQGRSAEEAAKRLETLAARVEKISEMANAGGLAAQQAADALATARARMPPPPGSPAAPFTAMPGLTAPPAPSTPTAPAAPSSSSVSSMQSYVSSMQSYVTAMQTSMRDSMDSMRSSLPSWSPSGVPAWNPATASTTTPSAATTSDMGTAFGAVGSGEFSFYTGAATADQQKAQAVHAMQAYESSLTDSGRLLGDARSAVPAAAPLPAATTPASHASPGQAATGVPWHRLVGAGPAGGLRSGSGTVTGAPVGGGSGGGGPGGAVPLGPGARVGAIPGVAGGPAMPGGPLGETAAARGGTHGGMVPPVGARGAGAEDERHVNQMPTINHGLFAVDEPTVTAVLGEPEERR